MFTFKEKKEAVLTGKDSQDGRGTQKPRLSKRVVKIVECQGEGKYNED